MANVTREGALAGSLRMRGLQRRLMIVILMAVIGQVAGWPLPVAAQDAEMSEYRVKAAYLYKFLSYAVWPGNVFGKPDTPFTIGVLGADGVAGELERTVAGRRVGERPIVVRRMKPGDEPNGLQVLFLGRAESARLQQLVPAAQTRSVLVVTESEGALRQGSVINFISVAQRIRFEISLDAADKSGLKLSSGLLAVAQQVVAGAR